MGEVGQNGVDGKNGTVGPPGMKGDVGKAVCFLLPYVCTTCINTCGASDVQFRRSCKNAEIVVYCIPAHITFVQARIYK